MTVILTKIQGKYSGLGSLREVRGNIQGITAWETSQDDPEGFGLPPAEFSHIGGGQIFPLRVNTPANSRARLYLLRTRLGAGRGGRAGPCGKARGGGVRRERPSAGGGGGAARTAWGGEPASQLSPRRLWGRRAGEGARPRLLGRRSGRGRARFGAAVSRVAARSGRGPPRAAGPGRSAWLPAPPPGLPGLWAICGGHAPEKCAVGPAPVPRGCAVVAWIRGVRRPPASTGRPWVAAWTSLGPSQVPWEWLGLQGGQR